MPRDLDAIEAALKTVDRELWVVSSADGPRRGGLLASWVSAASIDRQRPVMLVGLAPNHFTAELVEASGTMGLHLLGTDQVELALTFALGSGRAKDKFAQRTTRHGESGAPLLTDCVAWLEGRIFARLATGDRTFFWLDVIAGGKLRDTPPLREHDLFSRITPDQKAALLADRNADIALQPPLHDAWRENLPEHLRVE